MLFGLKTRVAEVIIDNLAEGSVDSLALLQKVKNNTPVTKQGFYRALRELTAEEIVTKNKQKVLLSPLWVNKVQSFIERTRSTSLRKESEILLHLAEGDTMVFRFKSVVDLYLLWNHYFFVFCQNNDEPVVFFNSHNFWALLRSDIENQMYAWIKSNKKKAYCVIGHHSPLDRNTSDYIRRDYDIELAYEEKPSIRETVFPAIFGDYIMSTILDTETVRAINEIYKKYIKWEPVVQTELENIISRMKRSKVVIERNKKKAEMLRKKLMNYFVFYSSTESKKGKL